ncbi:hypothetical protein DRT42_18985 [Salmonella enterica subsp. enterica serovar Manchester]|nr:hypothetical protein [Salmonella enterica subsp. enterica serovar Manchester]EBX3184528.1 hypothetical protein [Salmonella enterica subsp. enterica serovar Manchester]
MEDFEDINELARLPPMEVFGNISGLAVVQIWITGIISYLPAGNQNNVKRSFKLYQSLTGRM